MKSEMSGRGLAAEVQSPSFFDFLEIISKNM
jgi:hypothetical protein